MNPWGLYDHKPQLLQAIMIGATAWVIRTRRRPMGAAAIVTVTAIAWALVGVLDWFVYSFGFQFARMSAKDTNQLGVVLEWVRLLIVAIGIAAALRHARNNSPTA